MDQHQHTILDGQKVRWVRCPSICRDVYGVGSLSPRFLSSFGRGVWSGSKALSSPLAKHISCTRVFTEHASINSRSLVLWVYSAEMIQSECDISG